MKFSVSALAVCLASFLVCNGCLVQQVSPEQEVPEELLERARLQFNTAFEGVYGEEPGSEITERAMRAYKNRIDNYSSQLGRQAGLDQTQNGKAMHLLRGKDETSFANKDGVEFSKSDIRDLVRSNAMFSRVDGSGFNGDVQSVVEIARDMNNNTEVHFPEGVFEIDEDVLLTALDSLNASFPDGIVFVGSGKSRTTLKIANLELNRNDLFRLGFRGMTIDCDNDGLFDKRRGSLTLELSNVRIVRFDAGHGGCKVFGVNEGLLIYAHDTEFVGGFGSRPGMGSVFASSCDRLIGHFERCSFYGIDEELFRAVSRGNAMVWMDECLFDKRFGRVEDIENVEFSDCTFDVDQPQIDWSPDGVADASK